MIASSYKRYYLYNGQLADPILSTFNRIYAYSGIHKTERELYRIKVLGDFTLVGNPGETYKRGQLINLKKNKMTNVTCVYRKLLGLWKALDMAHHLGGEKYQVAEILEAFKRGIYPTEEEFKRINKISTLVEFNWRRI